MLTLPIEKKWFDMIAFGKKQEEYREIKSYWTSRFIGKELDFGDLPYEFCRQTPNYTMTVIFKNGYRKDSPQMTCKCRLRIGTGKTEWGAEPKKEYYILEILEILEIKNWDNSNSPKIKEAMAAVALPATPPIIPAEDFQEEIRKAINKQFAIGIDIGEEISRSGQSRKNTMMFGG